MRGNEGPKRFSWSPKDDIIAIAKLQFPADLTLLDAPQAIMSNTGHNKCFMVAPKDK